MWRVALALCSLLRDPRPAPQPIRVWAPIRTPARITAIAADLSGERAFFAGSGNGALFRSANGGRTWEALPLPPDLSIVHTIAVDPERPPRIFVGGQPTSAGEGFLRSSDGGLTWQATSLPRALRPTQIVIGAGEPETVYTVGVGVGVGCRPDCRDRILVSRDSGNTWTLLDLDTSATRLGPLTVDPTKPMTLYVGSDRGLLKSGDGGVSWEIVPGSGFNACGYVVAAGVSPSGVLFASAETPTLLHYVCNGIYRLRGEDGVLEGPQATGEVVTSFAFDQRDPNVTYASAYRFNPYGPVGLFRSVDGGDSWHPFDRGLDARRIARVAISRGGDVLLALTVEGDLYVLDFETNPRAGLRRSPRIVTRP